MNIKLCNWCLKSVDPKDIIDVRTDRCPYCGSLNSIEEVTLTLPEGANLLSLKEDTVLAHYRSEFVTWTITAPINSTSGVTYGHYYKSIDKAKEDFSARRLRIAFTKYLPKECEILDTNMDKCIILIKFCDVDSIERYATWKMVNVSKYKEIEIAYGHYFDTLEDARADYTKRCF